MRFRWQRKRIVFESRPHDSFDAFSTVHIKMFIELHVLTYVDLYAHATNTRACDIFGLRLHFDAFSAVFDRPD